jgi:6-pyruvoyl-tetrahydropterin synthase
MAETTQRGTPRLPAAVKQYATRLGKAGLDYRAIRIARTEQTAMLADEQTAIAEDSNIATGEMDFVMERGRDHWNCNCEKYAEQSPWKVDDPDRPEIPVHPNCVCSWSPRLKTDEEIIAAFKEEMAQDLEAIEGTQEQRDLLERIDGTEGEGLEEFPVAGASGDNPVSSYKIYDENDRETIFSNNTHEMPALEEKELGMTRGDPATLNQAINRVNPYYGNNNKLSRSNCVSSTVAFECQMNGYNAEALAGECDIKNAFSAFDFKEGDVERASKRGWLEMEDRMLRSDFPVGSRFIISQKWNKGEENYPWHNYNAIKLSDNTIRYADGQMHLDDIAVRRKHLRNNVGMDAHGYGLLFARVDDKEFKKGLDVSKIVKTSKQKLDNSLKNNIKYNNEEPMITKEEALELLIQRLKPKVENGETLLRYIGEYVGESEPDKDDFIFTVYFYSSENPVDPTYAFYHFVNKETKEIIGANAPEDEENLKWIQENCEKINLSVT